MKRAIAILIFVAAAFSVQAQKLGHTNVQDILMLMPERAEAEKQVQDLRKTLEKRLKTMTAEYEKKVNEFKASRGTMSPAVEESSIGEIQDLERRISEFQQTAQMEIQNKESELLEPMITKIENAIKKVGEENGYTYILDTSSGVVLFHGGGNDVTPKVKAELGL